MIAGSDVMMTSIEVTKTAYHPYSFIHHPLCDEFSVDNRHIDQQDEDDEDVVEETQNSKHGFRDNVERRNEIEEGATKAHQNSYPEHPDDAAEGKKVSHGMSQEGWKIVDVVHILRIARNSKIAKWNSLCNCVISLNPK